jgi:Integrase core domain
MNHPSGTVASLDAACPWWSVESERYTDHRDSTNLVRHTSVKPGHAPSACWQLDATDYVLTGGRTCVIFQLIDDHSRYAVASHVASGGAAGAIAVVKRAIAAHGSRSGCSATTGSR